MTGPSEEAATGQSDQAQEPAAELFSEERTDSTPHPNSDAFEVQPTQVVASPNPNSGPYATPQAPAQPAYPAGQYDQNLPPLQPQQPYTGYPQQQAAPPQPAAGQQQPGPQQAGPGLPQPGRPGPNGPDDLATAHLVKQAKRTPQSGWRKALYLGTGKLVNPGESPADRRRRELIARVNQPLRGCYKIAMLSLKGGVGKTTTTTTLGSTFASLRGDRVVAVDANPDRGTLSQKIAIETTATVRHLLRDAGKITRYSDVRSYTSQGSSRLEILASEQDPAVSEAFSEDDYRRTVNLLEHFYNIVLTDCGTGLMHSAMKGVLDAADALVVVSSGSVDGARSASATLDWLEAHGYGDLVKRSVVVINSVRPKGSSVDLDKLSAHFGAKVRAVCRVPFDPHLEEGAEIELERLAGGTRLSLLELAATVADGFGGQQYR
ncbi:MinD/ParA family ATP-binding protein [Amycolatopsis saalfeldensis]|uniref:MinD-like ATPase involved in chromosome partitioning or flagellar assembly n=1 Tax=Amycolatopsis saalfeldensis TaxID=394193 RepID=A0A1H8XP96_9PSEU|nr:MinD/ParA family protein [Amycolatopsis saalfeldensis]SEP41552.1 MinD-like ATPase involved in chromosome partitioning or flagellar assembly [Amycolatopsis saalfeldensis]